MHENIAPIAPADTGVGEGCESMKGSQQTAVFPHATHAPCRSLPDQSQHAETTCRLCREVIKGPISNIDCCSCPPPSSNI